MVLGGGFGSVLGPLVFCSGEVTQIELFVGGGRWVAMSMGMLGAPW